MRRMRPKKSCPGIKNIDKKRYFLATPGNNLLPKIKIIAIPTKTAKIEIKLVYMMLLPKISFGEYFPLPR